MIKPDIIIVCETWCNAMVSSDILNIDGYNIDNNLRKDRTDTTNGAGGGIIVYSKIGLNILESNLSSDFNQFSAFNIIQENGEDINIITTYRPPSTNAENTQKLCDIVEQMNMNAILIGDINLPGIKWQNNTSDSKGRKFFETVINNNAVQLVDKPTHKAGETLDLVITKNEEIVLDVEVIDNLSKSDHNMILVELTANNATKTTTTEKIYDWNRADMEKLRNEFKSTNWNEIFMNKTATEMWTEFTTILNNIQEKYVPLKLRRSNNRPSWMNQKLLRLIRKKKRLYKKFKKYPTQENENLYNKCEKEVKYQTKVSKKKFEKNLAKSKNKSDKKFNSYVKSRTKTKSQIGPLKDNHNNITGNDQEMCEILNDYFVSVFTIEDSTDVPVANQEQYETEIDSITFTNNKVSKKIDRLKNGSAPGNDKISVFLLKSLKSEIANPLSLIYEKSLNTAEVPPGWKESNVTAIHKKGPKSNPANYRPVSLTSICCKLMESIINDEIVEHLCDNKLIKSSQHGFLKNKSCATNLLEFLEKILESIDDGKNLDLLYLDFAKAFDKVPKKRLISKLKAHGITGNLLKWIESWLDGRKQRVVLNGKSSSWREVLSGIVQGSILGPLLFVIFINDIDDICTLDVMKKLADDTKCGQIITDKKDSEILQENINHLLEWSTKWGMEFNKDKCKIMHIGKNNPNFEYHMEGKKLTCVEYEKDIGVILNRKLKPSQHCSEAVRIANFKLYQISKSFHYRDKDVFLNLYKRFVRPNLEFSTVAWCPWTNEDKANIESVQMKAVNMISGLTSNNYEGKLIELKLESLESRREMFDMVQVYKILHNIDKVDETTWFTRVDNSHNRVTRLAADPYNLVKKRANNELYKNFFSRRVIDSWNNLPSDIKSARNINIFKAMYKKHTRPRI